MNAQERAKKLQWLKKRPLMPTQANTTQAITIVAYFSNAPLFYPKAWMCRLWMRSSFSIRANRKWMWCKRLGASCEKHRINNGAMSFCRWSYRRASRPKLRWMTTKTTKSVWQVLQALRAHDERFNAMINQIELNKNKPDKIQVIGVAFNDPPGQYTGETPKITPTLPFPQFEEYRDAFLPKLFLNVAVADIGRNGRKMSAKSPKPTLPRIRALLNDSGKDYRELFDEF